MTDLSLDTSYLSWRRKASDTFRSVENKITPGKVIFLSNEKAYLEELWKITYLSSRFSKVSKNVSFKFANFVAFLLKSTLFFDFAFSKNLKTKDSKIMLMYGDLYLAQGGIEFAKLDDFKKGISELKKTLQAIAISQKFESSIKVLDFKSYIRLVKLRYASIFKLAIIIPLIFGGILKIPRKVIDSYSTSVVLLISLTNNKCIKVPLSNEEKLKYMNRIRDRVVRNLEEVL